MGFHRSLVDPPHQMASNVQTDRQTGNPVAYNLGRDDDDIVTVVFERYANEFTDNFRFILTLAVLNVSTYIVIFAFFLISCHWDGVCSWNPSS